MDRALIDHRGPVFRALLASLLDELRWLFGAEKHVFIYPSSASGGWEAALVNTLRPGDSVLVCENGFFAARWGRVATRLGLRVETMESDWRRPVDPAGVEARLSGDEEGEIRAVLVVHNETSTGVTSDVAAIGAAMAGSGHPALLMVDAVSSLGATPFRQDEWGVDVTIAGSQKGLMLPPGLGFCAVSARAMDRHAEATLSRSYWDWSDMLEHNARGVFPCTPATTLLYGLTESLAMLREEGLERTFARHARHAETTRRAVAAWGLDNYCADPLATSNAGTTVLAPEGLDANAFRELVRARYDMSLGGGLGPLEGRVFRIGHLGDFNPLMLMGTLAGVEMGLRSAGFPPNPGGLEAAMSYLVATAE